MTPDTIRVLLAEAAGEPRQRLHTLLSATAEGTFAVHDPEPSLRLALERTSVDCVISSHRGALSILQQRIDAIRAGWVYLARDDADAVQAARRGAHVCLLEAELDAARLQRAVRLAQARRLHLRSRHTRERIGHLQSIAVLSALLHDQVSTSLQWTTRCISALSPEVPRGQSARALSGTLLRLEESRSALRALRHLRLLQPGVVEDRDLSDLAMHACRQVRLPEGAVLFRELSALPPVAVDPLQVQHALRCLIQNGADAVAEQPRGQRRVLVRSWETTGWVGVLVYDRGHGVPPGLQRRIFAPLYSTHSQPGAGMGLWTAALIAERHQGEVRLLPGEDGTCFALLLPRETGLSPTDITDIQLVSRAPADRTRQSQSAKVHE